MRLTIPTTISLPQTFVRKITSQAKRESLTRSELLRKAFQFYLTEQQWRELYQFGQRQSQRLGLKSQDVERLIDEVRTS